MVSGTQVGHKACDNDKIGKIDTSRRYEQTRSAISGHEWTKKYKVGDLVCARDFRNGNWFVGIIVETVIDPNADCYMTIDENRAPVDYDGILYLVKYISCSAENAPLPLRSEDIRRIAPRISNENDGAKSVLRTTNNVEEELSVHTSRNPVHCKSSYEKSTIIDLRYIDEAQPALCNNNSSEKELNVDIGCNPACCKSGYQDSTTIELQNPVITNHKINRVKLVLRNKNNDEEELNVRLSNDPINCSKSNNENSPIIDLRYIDEAQPALYNNNNGEEELNVDVSSNSACHKSGYQNSTIIKRHNPVIINHKINKTKPILQHKNNDEKGLFVHLGSDDICCKSGYQNKTTIELQNPVITSHEINGAKTVLHNKNKVEEELNVGIGRNPVGCESSYENGTIIDLRYVDEAPLVPHNNNDCEEELNADVNHHPVRRKSSYENSAVIELQNPVIANHKISDSETTICFHRTNTDFGESEKNLITDHFSTSNSKDATLVEKQRDTVQREMDYVTTPNINSQSKHDNCTDGVEEQSRSRSIRESTRKQSVTENDSTVAENKFLDVHHVGPVPGVEVGTIFKIPLLLAKLGVHRTPMAGIHGSPKMGKAFSVVLAGGFEHDHDYGDLFLYTGSGGKPPKTKKILWNQILTRSNMALAMSCNAPFNDTTGSKSENWKLGSPIRVIRSFKLRKYSVFAPTEGYRYDGIYKISEYYPETNKDGFILWRFVFKRDDPSPPPWAHYIVLNMSDDEHKMDSDTSEVVSGVLQKGTVDKRCKKTQSICDIALNSDTNVCKKRKLQPENDSIIPFKRIEEKLSNIPVNDDNENEPIKILLKLMGDNWTSEKIQSLQ